MHGITRGEMGGSSVVTEIHCANLEMWGMSAEEDLKSLREAVKGEQVAVDAPAAEEEGQAAAQGKLKKLFKTGDAELSIGSLVEAAVCKGALLQC